MINLHILVRISDDLSLQLVIRNRCVLGFQWFDETFPEGIIRSFKQCCENPDLEILETHYCTVFRSNMVCNLGLDNNN